MITEYFAVLAALTNLVGDPIRALSDRINLPLATALLLGVIGAVSPCQLTTNLSALAYVGRRADRPRAVAGSMLAYVLGKALVYTLIGLLVVGFGLGLQQQSIPVVVAARKALGPFMILVGLALMGLLRPRFSFLSGLSLPFADQVGDQSNRRAFLLGVVFSLAFCPTLFLLFFGLLVPLALHSAGGIVFPGVFAVGTSVPLLVLVAVLGFSSASLKSRLGSARRWGHYATLAAGAIFVLAGLNDTLIYWLL